MLMNLQGPVLAFQVPGGVTVFRPAQAVNVNGVMQKDPPTQITIKAAVMPFSGKQLLLLPEGDRTKEWINVYALDGTTKPVKSADVVAGTSADDVEFGGRLFKVMRVNDWSPLGGFWHAECARVGA